MSASRIINALASMTPQSERTPIGASMLLGFDTETTGIHAGSDAIVSASLVLRDPNSPRQDIIAEWVINPHRPMDPRASAVNGFTDSYLQQHGAEPIEALSEIARIIGEAQRLRIPLLAYNAPFDVRMLRGDLRRWQLETPALDADTLLVIDPLVIDRAVSRRAGKRNLASTSTYYGVVPRGDFHDATADTIAAVDLVQPLSELYPQVGALTLADAMEWQRNAYGNWQASFNSWLESQGRRPSYDAWL